ncbi:MAG: ribulose-phosphate 3-epimerase [Anaerolineales bacterium]|nr:ribulose-phosphate 3-epimerase [Anaerolineales bacterium]
MPKQFFFSPSILSADFANLADQIHQAEDAGANWIHIDVIDGHYAPNITMGPFIVEHVSRITALPRDVHLMIDTPERFIADFANAGANHLTVHVEASTHIYRTLESIRKLGCKPGITLNPGTPASALKPNLHLVDLVLVMTVNPGYSGQKFIPQMLPKIAEVRTMLDEINPEAIVEVDGGIDVNTLPQVIEQGAQAFVAASAIFKFPDGIAAGLGALKAKLPG